MKKIKTIFNRNWEGDGKITKEMVVDSEILLKEKKCIRSGKTMPTKTCRVECPMKGRMAQCSSEEEL